jgi:hypothetical protein
VMLKRALRKGQRTMDGRHVAKGAVMNAEIGLKTLLHNMRRKYQRARGPPN